MIVRYPVLLVAIIGGGLEIETVSVNNVLKGRMSEAVSLSTFIKKKPPTLIILWHLCLPLSYLSKQ